MARTAVSSFLESYPKVFFACHRRHVRDPGSSRVLSSHQASVIDHLDTVEPTYLNQLAKHMGVTPSTMSLMIDRLERGGYVRRSKDARDGRRTSLRLTKSGQRIKEQQKVLDPLLVQQLLEQLPLPQRSQVVTTLETLAHAADTMLATNQQAPIHQGQPK